MNFSRSRSPSAAIALLLYTAEAGGLMLALALALYKKGARPLGSFLSQFMGGVLILSIVTLIAAVLLLALVVHRSRAHAQAFWPTAFLNILSLILMLGSIEATLRALARTTPAGVRVANVTLLPRDWKAVAARNQSVVQRAAARETYLVYDHELGWTIGPNRQSKDYNRAFQQRFVAQRNDSLGREHLRDHQSDGEIYLSSTEGLRSPRAGMSFAKEPARRRIALIGDSFTFGLEVTYEETWGQQLEKELGAEFQVLNFGVDGYGVDQAFLRYRRDVVSWQPEVVILGIITDDLRRTMCVYGFLCFPESEIPFPKPRFALDRDTLILVNQPLLSPDSIFAAKSITDLPFIDYDPAFDRAQWQDHLFYRSFVLRFVLSRFPRWPIPGPAVTERALRDVNAELIRTFVRTAQDHGSKPIVVFFPSHATFSAEASSGRQGHEVLSASGVSFVDATPCVTRVKAAERFVVLHYSAATNAEVARCLKNPLERAIAGKLEEPPNRERIP